MKFLFSILMIVLTQSLVTAAPELRVEPQVRQFLIEHNNNPPAGTVDPSTGLPVTYLIIPWEIKKIESVTNSHQSSSVTKIKLTANSVNMQKLGRNVRQVFTVEFSDASHAAEFWTHLSKSYSYEIDFNSSDTRFQNDWAQPGFYPEFSRTIYPRSVHLARTANISVKSTSVIKYKSEEWSIDEINFTSVKNLVFKTTRLGYGQLQIKFFNIEYENWDTASRVKRLFESDTSLRLQIAPDHFHGVSNDPVRVLANDVLLFPVNQYSAPKLLCAENFNNSVIGKKDRLISLDFTFGNFPR